MHFEHSGEIWRDFPQLVPGILFAEGIIPGVSAGSRAGEFTAAARSRLAKVPEGELPEIQAWRRAFSAMGLKPTQYRCASESLLRRLRKEGSLPQLHPLVDLCNAVSAAFAIPVAVFDVSKITSHLEVRYAAGDEDYLTFSGDVQHPTAHEVIFADQARRVHARRWTNRQSGLSAVQNSTTAVLIVAEAVHDSAASDVPELTAAVAGELHALWSITPAVTVLSQSSPRFTFGSLTSQVTALLSPGPVSIRPGMMTCSGPGLGQLLRPAARSGHRWPARCARYHRLVVPGSRGEYGQMTDVTVRRVDFGYFIRPAEETGTGVPRVEPCLGYAVGHPEGMILFDTGMGSHPEVDAHYRPRRVGLPAALAAIGAQISDLRLAANCHLHFDHCGGSPLLGQIPVFVQDIELGTARQAPDYTLPELIEGSRFEPVTGQVEMLPGVFLVPTPGHTDGHQSLIVRRPDGAVIVAGQSHDTATQYAADQLAWQAHRDAHDQPLPDIPDWIDALQQFSPRMVYFAHDRSVWTP